MNNVGNDVCGLERFSATGQPALRSGRWGVGLDERATGVGGQVFCLVGEGVSARYSKASCSLQSLEAIFLEVWGAEGRILRRASPVN